MHQVLNRVLAVNALLSLVIESHGLGRGGACIPDIFN
jgi:hypothetical protein